MAELKPELTPRQFLDVLVEKKMHGDGIQFVAHCLPKRQGVWWALQCAKQVAGEQPPPPVINAIRATERWIAEPSDENRKATLPAAEQADTGSAPGCAAMAAYYSDGMAQSPDPQVNEKASFMTSKLVSASVLLAATADAEKAKERLEEFFVKGVEVAKRTSIA